MPISFDGLWLLLQTVALGLAILWVRGTVASLGASMPDANDAMQPIVLGVMSWGWSHTFAALTRERVSPVLPFAVVLPLVLWLTFRA